MRVREHRGLLCDSLNTAREIAPTQAAVTAWIAELLKSFPDLLVREDLVHVEPYGWDERIGWDTHIVLLDGYGVFGFTDGPLQGLVDNDSNVDHSDPEVAA